MDTVVGSPVGCMNRQTKHHAWSLQGNCVVVSDRQTAVQVVEYFRKHKVGTANCKILAELKVNNR